MNATSNTNFGRGVYGYEMDCEAVMTYRDFVWNGRYHTIVERKIPVRLNWVGIRSAGKTGYYIIYFDGADQSNLPPDIYKVEGKKSCYRCDSITMFKIGDSSLKKAIQKIVAEK